MERELCLSFCKGKARGTGGTVTHRLLRPDHVRLHAADVGRNALAPRLHSEATTEVLGQDEEADRCVCADDYCGAAVDHVATGALVVALGLGPGVLGGC